MSRTTSSVLPDLDWDAPGPVELGCSIWEGAGVSELPSLSLSPSLKPLPGLVPSLMNLWSLPRIPCNQ